jgi:hypothetical protein
VSAAAHHVYSTRHVTINKHSSLSHQHISWDCNIIIFHFCKKCLYEIYKYIQAFKISRPCTNYLVWFQNSKLTRRHVCIVDDRDSKRGTRVAQSVYRLFYKLNGRGSFPGDGIFFLSQPHPDRLWGPPSLVSNGYRGFLPRG